MNWFYEHPAGNAYYNEFDKNAAEWLRQLMLLGQIAPGVVDTRSIAEVRPDDLKGFTQCHFFAGIGGWSYALRLAGVSDDFPCWTGSPPCQPFSAAGQQKARNDDRHLAPHWATLINACAPEIVFGEQVASAAVFGKITKRARKTITGDDNAAEWAWLDDLSERLETSHYAVGATDLPATCVGGYHRRQRTFFTAVRMADTDGAERWSQTDRMADADGTERRPQADGQPIDDGQTGERNESSNRTGKCRTADRVGNAICAGPQGHARNGGDGNKPGRIDTEPKRPVTQAGASIGMADTTQQRQRQKYADSGRCCERNSAQEITARPVDGGRNYRSGPLYGPWANADWLFCRDGKWRPVEPGTFPLAHGIPRDLGRGRNSGLPHPSEARQMRLKGYGNAIVPQVAALLINAVIDTIGQ